jgi:hypothetical protein
MTTKRAKKSLPENTQNDAVETDDYYAVEKQRIAEETQKAHRIHEEDVHLHLVANIPYYDDADPTVRRSLVRLNNLLLHRYDQPWLIIWQFLRHEPTEIRDYAADFGDDLSQSEQDMLVSFLQEKKQEEENMVDMGFDEDGEDDDLDPIRGDDEIGNGDEEYMDTEEE